MIKIKLKFCGIFGDYFNSEIGIESSDVYNLASLREYIRSNLIVTDIEFLNDVLDKSTFTDGSVILSNDYILENNVVIYILPPFSGG